MVFRKWPRKKVLIIIILNFTICIGTLAWKLLLFEFLAFWFWHENCYCNNLLFLYEKCYFFVFLRLLYFGVKIVTLWVYCLLQFFGFGAKIDSVSNSLLWHENCYYFLFRWLYFGSKIVILWVSWFAAHFGFWRENCYCFKFLILAWKLLMFCMFLMTLFWRENCY